MGTADVCAVLRAEVRAPDFRDRSLPENLMTEISDAKSGFLQVLRLLGQKSCQSMQQGVW